MTGGTLGGRRLRAPSGRIARPTADRVREALFADARDWVDCCVLDAFAGSGALGIEALSRGARCVDFVERSGRVLSVLRDNLASLGLEERARVHRGDVAKVLRRLAREAPPPRFDRVLFDPPYASGEAAVALQALWECRLLAPGGRVIVESDRHRPLEAPAGYERVDERRYGDTVLVHLVAGEEDAPPVPRQE